MTSRDCRFTFFKRRSCKININACFRKTSDDECMKNQWEICTSKSYGKRNDKRESTRSLVIFITSFKLSVLYKYIRRCPSHIFRRCNDGICCGTTHTKIRFPTIFHNEKRVVFFALTITFLESLDIFLFFYVIAVESMHFCMLRTIFFTPES